VKYAFRLRGQREAWLARLAQPDSSSREPQSSAIAGAGEREPPQEPSSSPHRARVRCSAEFTGWPDRTDDRHRAGEGQDRPAEPCLQHPPAGDAETDGCRIGVVCPARPMRAPGAPNSAYSRQIMGQKKSPSRRAGDQSDGKIVIGAPRKIATSIDLCESDFLIPGFVGSGPMGQFSFFDADKRLAAISAKGDPLEMIYRVVPFDSSSTVRFTK
jgi:hypothetical protein